MQKKTSVRPSSEKAIDIIRANGGMVKTSHALAAGVSARTLYSLRDRGMIEEVSRGLYRLTELPPIMNPDLVIVGARVPRGVICLISALSFHEITTQIPHAVHIAVEKGMETPRISQPPVSVHWFSPQTFDAGIEQHSIDGINVRIYSPEKTIADCFKFRNKLGMDVILEALTLYKERKTFKVDDLIKYSKLCRVEKIIIPYLESII